MRQGGEDTLLNWSIRKGNSEGHTNAAKKQNIFSITKRHLSVTLWNVFVGLELCFPLTLSLCLTLVLVSLNASCIHLLSSTLYHPPPLPPPATADSACCLQLKAFYPTEIMSIAKSLLYEGLWSSQLTCTSVQSDWSELELLAVSST